MLKETSMMFQLLYKIYFKGDDYSIGTYLEKDIQIQLRLLTAALNRPTLSDIVHQKRKKEKEKRSKKKRI